ncbi:branched-chain amino acid transport system II carrier protein [Bacillus sinesaloumensis]|uniref:branched-chain amino acid transport system II carrier protein n=1 Tax=Litchfieldia sinesaloumensis TaxID=1926280 RepID=UPI0009884DDF|nr:branched-chain amino acid transport system II carrier protein [Bacillus sinesaloumensis]
MKKLDTLFIGFMLFSMFFGAGNLIFPPFLGAGAGTSFWTGMLGFIVTGVGLPVLVIFAVSLVKGGAQAMGNRVHPVFSTAFMVAVYLCIGPFLAIPRNANVAFEMGITPFLSESTNSALILLLFSAIFFGIVYFISLNPTKMEQYMGRIIAPTLVVAIVTLIIVGLFKIDTPFLNPTKAYQSGAFFTGFLEGYNTMDALASLAFGIVILNAIQKRGINNRSQLTRYTFRAGIIAGILLSAIYIGIGLIGAKMASHGTFDDGTGILSSAATLLFGQGGTVFLGIIFTLACFTTVVGLTTACGQYFSNLMPKVSYKTVVLLVTLVGFTLSNLGLAQILKVSVPFLVMTYPLLIVLVVLTFFSRYFKNVKAVYGSAMLFTGVFALLSGLNAFGLDLGPLQSLKDTLPLAAVGLEWVVPALIGSVLGLTISQFSKKEELLDHKEIKTS